VPAQSAMSESPVPGSIAAGMQSLLTQRATRYRGTDIDGPTLAPEGLWVRGRDLNSLIGAVSFEAAVWHLWFERLPDPAEHAAMVDRMQALARAYIFCGKGAEAVDCVSALGVEMVFAAATGFLCGVDSVISCANAKGSQPVVADADFDVLLACIVIAPYLMRAALGREAAAVEPAASHAERVWRLSADAQDSAGAERAVAVVDALLIAWHAGFGYITPTVLAPRCAIGTGVTLVQAIAAGFMASGPKHVGAALEAMQWMRDLPLEDEAVEAAVDAALDGPGALLFGFGHPLFLADPRPPHIRQLMQDADFGGPYLRRFDAACRRARARKGLNPNIDFITAAALLDAGVSEPQWGVGVGLCARIAAMAAHAVERRARPPFGVNSATARRLLAAVPVGWL
jgi:citrate synthase